MEHQTNRVEDAVGNAVCDKGKKRCCIVCKRLRRFKSVDSSVKVRDLVAKRRAERIVVRQIVAVMLDAADVNAAVTILRARKVRHGWIQGVGGTLWWAPRAKQTSTLVVCAVVLFHES